MKFKQLLKDTKFYGAGDRAAKTKLILETFEENYIHKEVVPFDSLTIEHVMPQTLSEPWKMELGEDWKDTYELYLHTIGNLTLTGYNAELSNDIFSTKKDTLKNSHLEINKYFSDISHWTQKEIEERSENLAKTALEIWPYFGDENSSLTNLQEVTGTTPIELKVLGQSFPVKSWRDVLEKTLNIVADLEPGKFEIVAQSFSHYLGKNKNKFREFRQLENGYYIEVGLGAQSIQRLCYKAIEEIDLTSDEWEVLTIR